MRLRQHFAPLPTISILALWLTLGGTNQMFGRAQSTQAQSAQAQSTPTQHAGSEQKSMAGELAEKTRESTGENTGKDTGEDQEEYSNLKHASAIQWMAKKTGMSLHQAHMVALFFNFAVIVTVVVWAARKFLPPMMRARNESIQRSLEEARAASQDANRRLSDIENRLRQLDVEIGQMQARAEKEADAEEARIQKAAEEDLRKVVLSAEQEITAAAKQARRELSAHTAELAISLASKQIRIDSHTDEMLVRSFVSTLASNGNQNIQNTNPNIDINKNKNDHGSHAREKDGR